MKPDPQKLDAVKSYPRSNSKKDVRVFLGLTGNYRKFVPHFSTVAEPLTELTKAKHPFKVKWSTKCEEAFLKLKELLVTPPILRVSEPFKPCRCF